MSDNREQGTGDEGRFEKPSWIRGKISCGAGHAHVRDLMKGLGLNSVCVSAACPNRGECWEAGHVTFMILGEVCTRGCLFCNVPVGDTSGFDPGESEKVARAVKELGIKYAVITSVTRDDLADRGAEHFRATVESVKRLSPETIVELLIPDFDADSTLIKKVAFCGADVVGHNIEMPRRLYGLTRPKASYDRSLGALERLSGHRAASGMLVKSAMMLGLGENDEEIHGTFAELKDAGVDILYIGQYLSPTKEHWPVKKYYTPEEFSRFEERAKAMGFAAVMSGPMVRSSYRAHEAYAAARAGRS